MKRLSLLLAAVMGVHAGTLPLQSYLEKIETSPLMRQYKAETGAGIALRRADVQTEGFKLYGELDYANEKDSDRDAVEFHVAVEKQLYFGDSDTFIDQLELSREKRETLKLNQLKNVIYRHYIEACSLDEQRGLINDMLERHTELTRLIKIGVEGGEFDRSSLLQSELIVGDLQLRIANFESDYYAAVQKLRLYTGRSEAPLCQDLAHEVPLEIDIREASLLYQSLEKEIETSEARYQFSDTLLKEMTIGAGYDNEIDIDRGLLYLQIPITQGDRRASERESARQAKLAADEALLFESQKIETLYESYKRAQRTRAERLRRLRDDLIPKAYESAVLLQERFLGSEGSYLEYIQGQKYLFDLLIRDIQTHADMLLAEATFYEQLGIDIQKDKR